MRGRRRKEKALNICHVSCVNALVAASSIIYVHSIINVVVMTVESIQRNIAWRA